MGFGPEVLIPLAIGAATTAGGAVMTSNANKQQGKDLVAQADKRNQQLNEYRERMKGIQANTKDNAAKAIQQYDTKAIEDKNVAAETALGQQYTDAVKPTVDVAPTPTAGDNPSVVEAATKVEAGRTNAHSNKLALNMAKLGATGQTMMGTGMGMGKAGSYTDMFNNFGRQEGSLLPAYQDFASTYYRLKPKASSPGGEALTGLGKTMLSAAGSGFKGFG